MDHETNHMNGLRQFSLEGKVAVVTGSSRGIGRAIAEGLAGAGAAVTVNGRNPEATQTVAAAIVDAGGKSLAVPADVGDAGEVERLIDVTVSTFGHLDILVNSAGISPYFKPAETMTEAEWDDVMNVNLKGVFLCCQAAGRVMIRQSYGRIISLSSQAGFVALPTESVYCMSKAAIAHLTKCLAVEWGKYNITVNAVAPTFISTPGTEEALADPAFRADVIERIAALHRIGEPMDVAGAVVFLASPAASLITGHTILIDGGWTAR